MKKIKLLTGLFAVPTAVGCLSAVTSCSIMPGKQYDTGVTLLSYANQATSSGWTWYKVHFESVPNRATATVRAISDEIILDQRTSTSSTTIDVNSDGTAYICAKAKNYVEGKKINFYFEVDFQVGLYTKTAKIDGVSLTTRKTKFNTDSWDDLAKEASKGIEVLKANYGLQSCIGEVRTIMLNSVECQVRVIGENHDDLADGSGKAALTFELTSVYCDTGGEAINSIWDTTNNFNYPNSVLRTNLTSLDTEIPITKSPLQALRDGNLELYNNLKLVSKKCLTANSDNKNVVTTYQDKLFSLSTSEINIYDIGDGTAYSYYKYFPKPYFKIKNKLSTEKAVQYWTTSPSSNIYGNNVARAVDAYGTEGNYKVTAEKPISFAFCI